MFPVQEGSSVTLKQLPYDDSETPQNHYVHTNHYKYTPGALELYDNLLYSCARHSTAIHHDTPKSVKDVCRILGDQSNSEGPIYRQNVPTDKSATLATGLFDLKSKLLHVFDKNPNQSDPCFSIPFLKWFIIFMNYFCPTLSLLFTKIFFWDFCNWFELIHKSYNTFKLFFFQVGPKEGHLTFCSHSDEWFSSVRHWNYQDHLHYQCNTVLYLIFTV